MWCAHEMTEEQKLKKKNGSQAVTFVTVCTHTYI